jgi:hypothetical protein
MRTYLAHLCLATFFFLALPIGFNWLIDSYGIFSKPADTAYFEANTRFQKTNYLTKDCQDYNSIIFGNSRAEVFPPEAINSENNRFLYLLVA